MSSINQEWKELKPRVGEFMSHLETLYKGAEDVGGAVEKAEAKGYNNGFKDGKNKQLCESCTEKAFYKQCGGYVGLFKKFLELDDDCKYIIKKSIEKMYQMQQQGEEE